MQILYRLNRASSRNNYSFSLSFHSLPYSLLSSFYTCSTFVLQSSMTVHIEKSCFQEINDFENKKKIYSHNFEMKSKRDLVILQEEIYFEVFKLTK